MIGSAVAEPNDEELNNKLEISVTIQKRTNAYGTTLLTYLMLNILVMLSSWRYWLIKRSVIYSSLNIVIIGTKPYGNGTTAELQPD